ncbi:histidine phosphatase family protein [Stackebrandtia nassauensis]|uniref:Phosphoglycerate mutase n=1 Tax=Stackebrandtia nassauensis (strain DSM 44728 / CIP 108903 / NRRL B-16338 / NBRC 102104 / LLR-40K-21) TaxID=446470 RepID=D3PVY4_STANL|nr:histidine phosphatase family protein [Stackebrandtia nassauensis]ADD45105.1 Phosphoglycerate mutase [Stackebrandtia nassauensis DSM 44728]
MKRLIVLRHGQTAWNDENRVQGSVDIDLNEAGRAQAGEAAKVLARLTPSVVVASDMRRAVDTAQLVADLVGLDVRIDKRLRERAYGPWEGLTRAQIAERFPEAFELWRARKPFELEDMEVLSEVADRTAAALSEVAAEPGDGTAVVVTHGGSSRQGIVRFLGWSQEQANTMFGMENCHWADLRLEHTGWRMYGYNLSA